MAPEECVVEKVEVGQTTVAVTKPKYWVILVLRLVAFLATISATIVMALNKETKTLVVATVGSTPVTATVAAKFQQTPAFVFFVVANGMASFHNLLMLLVDCFGQGLDYKGLRVVMIPILDMLLVALLSGGATAAAFMAELGKNGNSHARWNKICDRFDAFCDHGGGAIISSFIGLALLLVISVMSIITLQKLPIKSTSTCSNVVP